MMNIELALEKYKAHKQSCSNRKDKNGNQILMKLTFDEWCYIWDQSGKWEERGRGIGKYCMSRKNDIGHYEIGNVQIKLFSENTSEGVRRIYTEDENKKKSRPGPLNAMFGRKHSEETKLKIKEKRALQDTSYLIGRKHSEETKIKQSEKAKQRPKLVCEHCAKSISQANYVRWHGDKCKFVKQFFTTE